MIKIYESPYVDTLLPPLFPSSAVFSLKKEMKNVRTELLRKEILCVVNSSIIIKLLKLFEVKKRRVSSRSHHIPYRRRKLKQYA